MIFQYKELLPKLRIVLGSQSSGRQGLLRQTNMFDFRVVPSDFEENLDKAIGVKEYVVQTCMGKVHALLPKLDDWDICIFADTVCELDGEIIEKANTPQEAMNFLKKFNNKTHWVHTCVVVAGRNAKNEVIIEQGFDSTEVFMQELSDKAIEAYVRDEINWKGKSGAYSAQGQGQYLIKSIKGDYSNVVGLPLSVLNCLMCKVISNLQ